jgi:repressor LexA
MLARRKYTELEKEIMIKSAQNLKDLLNKNNVSQKKLSEITGLSTSVISDYINAKTLMSPGSIELISSALGVETTAIYNAFSDKKDSEEKSESPKVYDIEKMAEGILEFRGRVLTDEQKEMYLKMTRALFE